MHDKLKRPPYRHWERLSSSHCSSIIDDDSPNKRKRNKLTNEMMLDYLIHFTQECTVLPATSRQSETLDFRDVLQGRASDAVGGQSTKPQ